MGTVGGVFITILLLQLLLLLQNVEADAFPLCTILATLPLQFVRVFKCSHGEFVCASVSKFPGAFLLYFFLSNINPLPQWNKFCRGCRLENWIFPVLLGERKSKWDWICRHFPWQDVRLNWCLAINFNVKEWSVNQTYTRDLWIFHRRWILLVSTLLLYLDKILPLKIFYMHINFTN